MAISLKGSSFSLMLEASEGTITPPAAVTDFIPVQPDLSLTPAVDTLDNEEMRSSIGMGKKIIGAENPEISFSHYLKHSGIEGQAPAWGKAIKSVFGGVKVVALEDEAAIGSTVAGVKVADASIYQVGEAILIKDAINGYSIRPIHSIDTATDILTLGFTLAAAPAASTKLGKCVSYYPANSGHPTLTAWRYTGNNDAIDMVRGARVSEMGISATANELINCSFSMNGVEYYFNPIEITAGTKYLDFNDGTSDFAVTVAVKYYKTPNDLADALQVAMNAAGAAGVYTVVYSASTGKFTIAATGGTLTLKWSTGTNTANTIGTKIGFAVAADDASAMTYTSDNAQVYTKPYTPSYDNSDPLVAKGHLVTVGDATDNSCFGPSSVEFTVSDEVKVIDNICSDSGRSGSVVTGRTVTASFTAQMNKYDADKIYRMLNGKDTRFMYVGGVKSGGNWVAGKSFCLYLPYCAVSSFEIADEDSLAVINVELSAFVPADGGGEVFLNFL
jgi:hypothetical protein